MKMTPRMLLMKLTNAVTPECRTIAETISRSMDEKISLRERLAIRIHNLGCILCDRYRKQLLMIRKMLENLQKVDQDESIKMPASRKERIEKDIHTHL